MLQLTGAGKRFGHKLLFEGLDWLITPKERAGLVGGNGTGKSTLLKVIAGLEPLDYGSISAMKGIRLGYLPQDGLRVSGRTVFAECLSVFASLKQLEQELQDLSGRMSDLDPKSDEYRSVGERFEQADREFHVRDGYAVEAQVGAVLTGLGFRKEDWTRQTEEFSGGWQMRIALAKLLLEKPNVLLLDEPTNHLDIEAREWLEDYLKRYEHAYILISHDRYFLDVTVSKTVEIWNKRVHFYSGNYEKYRQQKAERLAQLEAAYKNQREKIEQLEAFIDRFRYQATKAKQVQSRIKELERIERIELPPEEKTIHFSFPQPKPSGRVVAEFKNVAKSYGAKPVFGNVSFTVERGDRIALVGVNGAGKSTLIKLLAGTEPLTSGEYTLGHNVEVDYFAQDQYKELDADARVFDDLRGAAPRSTQTELRSLLGCFLFSEDDVFKRIGVLSGGERNRYALARMLQRPSNFILLDEPTNHLDLRAKDVLLEALQEYSGTVIFVSHDRYFLEQLANRVFDDLRGAAPRSTETELRSLLGCFLFSEDDVFKRIGVLSGGERNRYALARMLQRPSNFILLDEPTNHLDLRAKDVLLEALQEYSGTVIFVSHDRYFLEQLANRVFEVGEGEVRIFPGNYADYLWRKEGGHEKTPTLKDVLIGVPPAEPVPMPTAAAATREKRVNPMKLKQMKEQAQVLEERIARLEADIQASELALSDFSGPAEAARLAGLLEAQRADLERAMGEWEQVSEEIEATA